MFSKPASSLEMASGQPVAERSGQITQQLPRQLPTDTAARAGNQDNLILEVAHAVEILPCLRNYPFSSE
jgi:hypothetical protein